MENTIPIKNIDISKEYVRRLQFTKYIQAAKRLNFNLNIVYLATKGFIVQVIGESKEVSDKFLQVNELNLADIYGHIKVLEGIIRELADTENKNSLDSCITWQSYLIDIVDFLKNYKVGIK